MNLPQMEAVVHDFFKTQRPVWNSASLCLERMKIWKKMMWPLGSTQHFAQRCIYFFFNFRDAWLHQWGLNVLASRLGYWTGGTCWQSSQRCSNQVTGKKMTTGKAGRIQTEHLFCSGPVVSKDCGMGRPTQQLRGNSLIPFIWVSSNWNRFLLHKDS